MTEQEKQQKHENDWMWRIGMYDCALFNYAWAIKNDPNLKSPSPTCDCKICQPRAYKL